MDNVYYLLCYIVSREHNKWLVNFGEMDEDAFAVRL